MKKISGYIIHCEICGRRNGDSMRIGKHTALGEARDIKLPLNGSMIGSPDSLRKIPPPFPRAANWQEMKCPRCRRIPWLFTYEDLDRYMKQGGPDRVFTDEGWISLVDEPNNIDEEQAP